MGAGFQRVISSSMVSMWRPGPGWLRLHWVETSRPNLQWRRRIAVIARTVRSDASSRFDIADRLNAFFSGAVSANHSTNFSAASMGISFGSQLMRACPLSLNLPSPAVPRLAASYRHGGGTAPCDAIDPALGARSLTTAPIGPEPVVCRPATVSAWERKVLHEGGVESACDMSV